MEPKDVKYCPTCGSEYIRVDKLKKTIKCLRCKSKFIYDIIIEHYYGKTFTFLTIVQQRK